MSSSQNTQRICRFYNTPKGCANGDNCKFPHIEQMQMQNNKNRTCKFFAKGNCNKGDACAFSHEQPLPKDQIQCRFDQSSSCNKGDECEFMHGQ
jgi:hypothetical protein